MSKIVKYVSPAEQELIDMLIAILRGKNERNKRAITGTIEVFYLTRDVIGSPGRITKLEKNLFFVDRETRGQ